MQCSCTELNDCSIWLRNLIARCPRQQSRVDIVAWEYDRGAALLGKFEKELAFGTSFSTPDALQLTARSTDKLGCCVCAS